MEAVLFFLENTEENGATVFGRRLRATWELFQSSGLRGVILPYVVG